MKVKERLKMDIVHPKYVFNNKGEHIGYRCPDCGKFCSATEKLGGGGAYVETTICKNCGINVEEERD